MGFLPPGLFGQIKQKFVEKMNEKELRFVNRDDRHGLKP